MRKWTVMAVAVVSLVLVGLGATMVHRARRDRTELLTRFADEHHRRLGEVVAGVEHDLASVADNLSAVARLLHAAGTVDERRHELAAVLAAIPHYRLIAVYDAAGQRVLSVTDPLAAEVYEPDRFQAALRQTATHALPLKSGALSSSPPLRADATGWLRIFAAPLPRGASGQPTGAMAVLVDTEPFFASLQRVAAEPGAHLLVLGPAGRPVVGTGGPLAARVNETEARQASPWLDELVRGMRAGHRGTVPITAREALGAGLGRDPLIATYAPVRMAGGAHWSVATVSSTSAVRAHQRAALRWLALTAAVIAVCLIGFGAFMVVASRRAVALREQLRHAAEIAHLHEKTQKILDNIPTGVLALSEAGIAVAANRALRERMPRTALGAPLAEAFPEAPTATIHRLRVLIEETRESSRVQSLFGARLALFGEEEPYNVHVVPLEPRFPDTRFLLVLEDLSEVRALESQLLRAEKLATVGTLAAGIAHEIGTPLGVVRGRAAYVLGTLGRDHPQGPGIQVIIEQIDHVAGTLRQLLDFARVKPAVVRAVSVALVARTVVGLLDLEASARKLSLHLEILDDVPDVAADPDQLQQVLVNLVMNAYDANQPNGHVTIRASLEDVAEPPRWRRVRIDVIDDGCGIPPEHRNQVFDPFFTTKKAGRGTGLGLAIAAQIVRNHGGEIDLGSAPQRGTCVTVLWPTPPLEVGQPGDATDGAGPLQPPAAAGEDHHANAG